MARTQNEIYEAIQKHIHSNNGDLRKDWDAINEGWNPAEYADESLVFRAVAEKLGITEDEEDDYLTLWDEVVSLFE